MVATCLAGRFNSNQLWRGRWCLDDRLGGVDNRVLTLCMRPRSGWWSFWTRHPEPAISLPRTGVEVLDSQVTLELESWDRVDLNVDQPKLRTPRALCHWLRDHYGEGAVSSHQMKAITEPFLESIDQYAREHHVPLLSFEKSQRKEDLAAKYLAEFSGTADVLFIAKAQEKIRTCRTEGRRNERGPTYPWIMASTAVVHQYSFDAVDGDFGLFFLKYSSYFPDGAKLCFNGPESLKRQLTQEGIGYEELTNGILSGENPRRMQKLADGFTPWRIERFLRKWQNHLPHPFTRNQQTAGSRDEISMCQVEFALTQIVDRPVQGRIFVEEVVRENLDLGRPDNRQLIFGHRVTKRTTSPFRTRVVRAGVIPSLLVDSKLNRSKEYFKEGRGLGTELTVHNPGDDGLGRRLGESSRSAGPWFSKQPTGAARPNPRPRLRPVPRMVPWSDRSTACGRPTGLRLALRRAPGAGPLGGTRFVPAVALGISPS